MNAPDPSPVFVHCPQCNEVRPHLPGATNNDSADGAFICMRCDNVHTQRTPQAIERRLIDAQSVRRRLARSTRRSEAIR